MSKSITLNCFESSGVAGSKLKCPNPAPWICTTGSPSPEIRCQRLTPLTSIMPSITPPTSVSWRADYLRCLTSKLRPFDRELDPLRGERRERVPEGLLRPRLLRHEPPQQRETGRALDERVRIERYTPPPTRLEPEPGNVAALAA